MFIDPKSVKKITILTSKGEQPIDFKASHCKGIVIQMPSHLPFLSLSVLKLDK